MTDRELIEAAYADLNRIGEARAAVDRTIAALDAGAVRVAEKVDGEWVVNAWVKEAIMLYFRLSELETMEAGPFEYHDKIPTKRDLAEAGVRVVPPGTVRYGAFCEPGVVVMPGYVNIGAYVGAGHHGRHLGHGRLLRPDRPRRAPRRAASASAACSSRPEPGRSSSRTVPSSAAARILVEGVLVEEGAVLGANTTITSSTPIIDVTGSEPVEIRGTGAGRIRRPARHAAQGVPGRHLRPAVRPHRRHPVRLDRSEDVAQRRPADLRGAGVTLTETLAWLVDIPSETGQEGRIATAIAERLLPVYGPQGVERIGNSLVVGPPRGPAAHLAVRPHRHGSLPGPGTGGGGRWPAARARDLRHEGGRGGHAPSARGRRGPIVAVRCGRRVLCGRGRPAGRQ